MALEDIGCRAVVEGLSQFKSSFDQMNQKTQEYVNKTVEGMNKAQNSVDKFAESIGTTSKKLGVALSAAGAAITAAAGMAVKAAIEIEGTRIAYENLAATSQQSANEILEAMKKASMGAVSDNDLMLAANRAMTLGVAKNSREFASLMEIARDRARTMGLSTTQAFNDIVTGIGRGSPLILDNLGLTISLTEANERYAEVLGKNASDLTDAERKQALLNEVMRQGQETLDKTAQGTMTTSDTLQSLGASMSNIMALVGETLLPIFDTVSKAVADIIKYVQGWIEQHPALTQAIVIFTGVLGGLALVIGGLILALPILTKMVAAFGVVLHVATGPVGWITLAISALTAAGIVLCQNWDKVVVFFREAWENIKIAFAAAIKFIISNVFTPFLDYFTRMTGFISEGIAKVVGFFNEDLANTIRDTTEKLKKAGEEVNQWADNIITNAQINKAAIQAEKMASAVSEEVNKTLKDNQETAWDYEKWERYYSKLKDAVNDWFDEQRDALDNMAKLESSAHKRRMKEIQDEYDKTIRAINDELKAKKQAYSDEMDAIDEQLEALESVDKERAYAQEKAQLETQIATEYDLKKKLELNQELNDLIVESGNEEWQEERKLALEREIANEQDAEVRTVLQEKLNDFLLDIEYGRQKAELEAERKTLQDKIAEAEKEAERQREIAQDTYKYKMDLETEAYERFTEDMENRREALDTELKETLKRYDQELEAYREKSAEEIEETRVMVTMINNELDKLRDRTITITTAYRSAGGGYPLSYEPPPFAEGGYAPATPGGRIVRVAEAGEGEYMVPESRAVSFAARMLRPWLSQSLKASPLYGSAGGINNSRNINYNVTANYSRSQSPISLRHDLEAIAMMARG